MSPSDYIRTDLTVENGLPDNVVNAIVESKNGLLWVGTSSGLASFDGREFHPMILQAGGSPAQGSIHSMVESLNGDLWVGTDVGVVRIPKAALNQFSPDLLTFYRLGSGPSNEVQALLQARDGTLWAGTNRGLYREDSGKFVEVIPGASFSRIAETSDSHLLCVGGGKLIEWNGHKPIPRPDLAADVGVPESDVFDIFQDADGTMWYSAQEGIFRRGQKLLPQLRPTAAATTTSFRRPITDPEGSLWVISGTGVYRVNGDVMEDTPVPNVHPRCFYADREGGYWVGTNGNGLIHLKRRIVKMFTTADGLISNIPMAVLSSHDGKLWIGCNCGLSAYDGKRFTSYREKDGLLNSCVWSLAEDKNGDLWIGTYGGGLFRFSGGRFVQYGPEQGLVSKIVTQIAVAQDGSLWMATPDGISHMQKGHFQNYTTSDGLLSNQVLSVFEDHSGAVWAATQGGIDRLAGKRFVPFPAQAKDGTFAIRFAEDSAGDLYATNSPKGISLIRANQLIPVSEELKAAGMVESPQRDLWFSGTNGILRVRSSDLKNSFDEHDVPLAYELIDQSDGLISMQCSVGSPNMAITPDDKLWVATVKGLAMLDLAHPRGAGRKPKVFVGAVTIGANKFFAGNETILPPGIHHVELHLEAVDLTSPEKIRLQYRLDDVDSTWLDASASRTAVYTSIPIGAHAFHVRASSSDGVWDRKGMEYAITQQPYFYQTTWFFAICVAALALLAWEASQWRVRQARARAHLQNEERLAERARIARELHDTLLQSFQGLILNFQRARNLLPEQPQQATESLDSALDRAERAIIEGRDAIHDIRTVAHADGDLAKEISALGEELRSQSRAADPPTFQVVLEGSPNAIRPVARDELYRFAREALRNAFAHAHARNIEAEIRFEEEMLRLRIRDDGIGIDKKHLGESGRTGHYGLRGMRERAVRIGAQFDVWTQHGAGTEIELRVPQRIAYELGGRGRVETDQKARRMNDGKS